MYIHLALSLLILCSSCGNTGHNAVESSTTFNPDTVFIKWNRATIKSIRDRISSVKDSTEKSHYENRLSAFKAFIEINHVEEINKKSIRYEFLNLLTADTIYKDFFIIEANRSGEVVEIINYVVCPMEDDLKVVEYNYEEGKWIKKSATQAKAKISGDLKSQFVKFYSGFNQDDIIIAHIHQGEVKSCEYYIYSTLSAQSPFKKIVAKNN